MENSAEALKFAFAIFVFILALTTVFMVISQAKSTSDTVLYYADRSNFQQTYHNGSNIVGVDDLISTLLRYYKESLSVTIKDTTGTIVAVFDTAIEGEATWRGNNEKTLKRIKEFITGDNPSTDFVRYINSESDTFDYEDPTNYHYDNRVNHYVLKDTNIGGNCDLPNLLNDWQNARFEKTFVEGTVDGEYHTPDYYTVDGSKIDNDGTTIQITPGTKKVYITYQLQP